MPPRVVNPRMRCMWGREDVKEAWAHTRGSLQVVCSIAGSWATVKHGGQLGQRPVKPPMPTWTTRPRVLTTDTLPTQPAWAMAPGPFSQYMAYLLTSSSPVVRRYEGWVKGRVGYGSHGAFVQGVFCWELVCTVAHSQLPVIGEVGRYFQLLGGGKEEGGMVFEVTEGHGVWVFMSHALISLPGAINSRAPLRARPHLGA